MTAGRVGRGHVHLRRAQSVQRRGVGSHGLDVLFAASARAHGDRLGRYGRSHVVQAAGRVPTGSATARLLHPDQVVQVFDHAPGLRVVLWVVELDAQLLQHLVRQLFRHGLRALVLVHDHADADLAAAAHVVRPAELVPLQFGVIVHGHRRQRVRRHGPGHAVAAAVPVGAVRRQQRPQLDEIAARVQPRDRADRAHDAETAQDQQHHRGDDAAFDGRREVRQNAQDAAAAAVGHGRGRQVLDARVVDRGVVVASGGRLELGYPQVGRVVAPRKVGARDRRGVRSAIVPFGELAVGVGRVVAVGHGDEPPRAAVARTVEPVTGDVGVVRGPLQPDDRQPSAVDRLLEHVVAHLQLRARVPRHRRRLEKRFGRQHAERVAVHPDRMEVVQNETVPGHLVESVVVHH